MSYFIIQNHDGDTTVERATKEEVERRLNEEDLETHSEAPKDADTNYWGEKALIIKGEIVSPKPSGLTVD